MSSKLVAFPQYPFADTFDDLPDQDQERIFRDARAATESYQRAYAAFAAIRHPITENTTGSIGIERMDPIAGATRVLVGSITELGETLLGEQIIGESASPAEVEEDIDTRRIKGLITNEPARVLTAIPVLDEVAGGAGAILDYLTHLRSPHTPAQSTLSGDPQMELSELRSEGARFFSEVALVRESLRRVAVRHPEIEFEKWPDANG